MDKGALYLAALAAGLLAGLAGRRRLRPLLAERWRGLGLLVPAILVSVLPFVLWQRHPEQIWSGDRSLIIALIVLRSAVWILLFVLNLLPAACFPGRKTPGLTAVQKVLLLPALIGLAGEAAVLVANQATWPVPEALLTLDMSPAFSAGIRNQAFVFLRIAGEATPLAWLGQIWYTPWLRQTGLAALPTISPAEVVTAAGVFLIGLGQFLAPVLKPEPPGHDKKSKRKIALKGKR